METSATLPRTFLSLQTHANMFTRNLSYTILNHSDNMLKKNNGFDNAEELPFDSLMFSIFHILTRCIKCTNDQQTHFNYTDVLLQHCCHQQVQGDFFKNRHILFIHSFHWHVQNATIPCRSQELLPFLSVMYFFLPPSSTNYSSILSHLILPSISWSTSQSCCSQIHI